MAEEILKVSEIDVSKIKFGQIRTLEKTGGKIIPMSYTGRKYFQVQTPEMRAPFGLNKWDKGGPVKWSIDLSFGDADSRPSVKAFQDFLKELDNKILEAGHENSFPWLNAKKPKELETTEGKYAPLIKYSKDKATGNISDKYPPTVKLSLQTKTKKDKDGNIVSERIEAYDEDADLFDLMEIDPAVTKGAKVVAIIQLSSLWVVSGRFGCSAKVVQIQLKTAKGLVGFAIKNVPEERMDDNGTDGGDIEVDMKNSSNKLKIADSDEEEEEEEEEDEDDSADNSDDENNNDNDGFEKQSLKKVVKGKK